MLGTLSKVLIVEAGNGDIYFVEDKNKRKKISPNEPEKLNENFYDELDVKTEPPWEEGVCEKNSGTTFANNLEFKEEEENWTNEEENSASGYEEITFEEPSEPVSRRKRRKLELSEAELRLGGISFAKHKIRNLRGVFSCKYCDTVFATRADKEQHDCEYLKCDPKNFICRFCGKERSRATFSNHAHEAIECPYCSRKILNPRNMKLHIQKRHKGEKFKPLGSRKAEDLEEYIRQKESEEGEVYERRKRIRMEEHTTRIQRLRENYSKKNLRYICDYCSKQFASRKTLSYHLNMHLNIPLQVCENCGCQLFTPSGARSHSCSKEKKTIDSKYCRYCDQNFSSSLEKKNHECAYQIDDKIKICRICDKQISISSYSHHQQTHSDNIICCDICSKEFSNKRCLKVHLLTHQKDKPFQCEQCQETFINRRNLEYHMRFHGEQGKSFKCEYCFTTLCSEFSLKSHIQRKHTSLVVCEICKTECSSRDELKDHLKNSHEPFQCSYCSKFFALPRYLKAHEKTHFHDNSPRITCSICTKPLLAHKLKCHVFRLHPDQFNEWQQLNPNY